MLNMMHRKWPGNNGFTLMELLVSMAVIAVLAALVVGLAGVAQRKSTEARATKDLQNIANALEEYRLIHGAYPPERIGTTTQTGLRLLTNKEPNKAHIPQEMIDTIIFVDPWERDYVYTNVTRYSYRVFSRGLDITNTFDDITTSAR